MDSDGEQSELARVFSWIARHSKELMTVAAFLVPITVGAIGYGVNQTIGNQTVDAQHLNIAIRILSIREDGQRAAKDQALRDFAVDILLTSSPVEISATLEGQLRDGSTAFDFSALSVDRWHAELPDFTMLKRQQQRLIEASAETEVLQDSELCVATILGRNPFGGGATMAAGSYGVEATRELDSGARFVRLTTGSWLKLETDELDTVLSGCKL